MAEEKDENYTELQHDCDDDDAPSPSASPRDKKQRHCDSEASCHSIPGANNRQLFSGRDLLVAGSSRVYYCYIHLSTLHLSTFDGRIVMRVILFCNHPAKY